MLVRKRKGFTLIETLTAIAISAMLLAALTSYALAFMQVSREGEVMHRLQRELVFSFEAIEAEMRIAKAVSPGGDGIWTIHQIDYEAAEYVTRDVVLKHDPDARTLTLRNRVLSSNVAEFDISPGSIDERLLIRLATIGSLPMIKAGNLPLVLQDEVVMRNYGFVPPGEEPEDPEEPPPPPPPELLITLGTPAGDLYGTGSNSNITVTVTCTTSIDAECQLEWSRDGETPFPAHTEAWDASGTSHSWTISGLRRNRPLSIQITARRTGYTSVSTGVVVYTIRR